MQNLDREELIGKIVSSRVQDILVPSDVFGRPMLVKTTKRDIVARIRREYAEGPTNLKFRLRPHTNSAIVQAIGEYIRPKAADTKKAAQEIEVDQAPKRGRGRPKGSKNKSKTSESMAA